MKILIFMILGIIIVSCDNNEVIVRNLNEKCSCIDSVLIDFENALRSDHDKNWVEKMKTMQGMGRWYCNENNFDLYFFTSGKSSNRKNVENNKEVISGANEIELFNPSDTKIIEVTVKIDNNGYINYKTYRLEPTKSIMLGCSKKFNIGLNNTLTYQEDYSTLFEHLIIKSSTEINYTIHKSELISEY
jgi:hypothetical protein